MYGSPGVLPFHLLQAVASYRPREQGGKPQPICMIFPFPDANLEDVWRQSLVTNKVQSLVQWALTQMAGLAQALAFAVRNDSRERYISLRQITPCNIRWTKHTIFESCGWGALRLDLGSLMIGESKAPLRSQTEDSQKAYRAPDKYTAGNHSGECSSVWSFGCICLEFLIWAVSGWASLQRFREARGGENTPFYLQSKDDLPRVCILSPEVYRWAATLHKGSEVRLAVVRPLLEYLLGNVLVVDPSARVSASKLASDLEELWEAHTPRKLAIEMGLPSRIYSSEGLEKSAR
jgi:serine/threonine protein kinase